MKKKHQHKYTEAEIVIFTCKCGEKIAAPVTKNAADTLYLLKEKRFISK